MLAGSDCLAPSAAVGFPAPFVARLSVSRYPEEEAFSHATRASEATASSQFGDRPFSERTTDPSRDVIDLSDAVAISTHLFLSGPAPECLDASDVNDDAEVDISDPVSLLGHLVLGAPAPPAPFPEPGEDPTSDDAIQCALGRRIVTVTRFVRNGDVNADGVVDTADANLVLAFISGAETDLLCADAADVDDDGAITCDDYCAICPDCCPPPLSPDAGPGLGPTEPCVTDESPDDLGCTVSICL